MNLLPYQFTLLTLEEGRVCSGKLDIDEAPLNPLAPVVVPGTSDPWV
jgi:hypothetical protein